MERSLQLLECPFLNCLDAQVFHRQIAPFFPLRDYAQKGDLSTEAGIILRPWMLNYDPECGMKGFIEPARTSERTIHVLAKSNGM